MKKGNLVAATLCGILGITIIAIASGYPGAEAYGTGAPGPGLWPICIAIVLLICTAMLFYRTFRMKPEDDEPIVVWGEGPKRAYISMGVLLVYIIILPMVGFLLSTFAMLGVFIHWFHRAKPVKTALISLLITVVVYAVFRFVLNVPIDFGMFAI